MKNGVTVAVTGLAWMGSGIGSIETSMESLFRESRQEILITAYAVSNAADMILNWMEGSLSRGVLIRFAINKLNEQPQGVARRLNELNQIFPHFHLYTFQGDGDEDLHAKVIVADRNSAIVGSSNLSRRGLHTNHELALIVKGQGAQAVAEALDKLFTAKHLSKIVK